MPFSFLSPAQRERYGRYDDDPSAERLARYFHLDDADRAAIAGKRGEHNRRGYAVQLTTVRFLGTFLEDLGTVPSSVLQMLRRQRGLSGHNKRLNQFTLRSRRKVDTQLKLYCLVRNIEKQMNYGGMKWEK